MMFFIRFLRPVLRRLLAILAVSVLSACSVVETAPLPIASDSATSVSRGAPAVSPQQIYRLRPGDVVDIFVFDNPDLSQRVAVAPDGRLNYPLAGSIPAQGRTLDQIASILSSRFSNSIVSPQVTVSLVTVGPYRIFVNGEVAQPGAFDLEDPITLVQAITLSGGFTAFASRRSIMIYNPTRRGGARWYFNYDAFLRNPQAQDIVLNSGDTIIVP